MSCTMRLRRWSRAWGRLSISMALSFLLLLVLSGCAVPVDPDLNPDRLAHWMACTNNHFVTECP